MNNSIHIPILMYRDFYDFPRIFIVEYNNELLLLDCVFDVDTEEYVDYFSIYTLDTNAYERITSLKDWNDIYKYARKIGEILVNQIKFDTTRKKYIYGNGFRLMNDDQHT